MPLLLLLAFVVVPLVELYVIVGVADVVGVLPTIALLLAVSVVGAWLVRREGATAWRRFQQALGTARLPAAEVVDGALVLVGGTLLLTPGFVTDAVGLLLVIPPSRALLNRGLRRRARRWAARGSLRIFGVTPPPGGSSRGQRDVVDVEVVEITRDER